MKRFIISTAVFCIFFGKIYAQSPLMTDKFILVNDGSGNFVLYLNNNYSCVSGTNNFQSFGGNRNDILIEALKAQDQPKSENIMILLKDESKYIFKFRQGLWIFVDEPVAKDCVLHFEQIGVTTSFDIECAGGGRHFVL